MRNHFLIITAACLVSMTSLFAQDRKDKAPVTFEELYDEPYSINKLFVGFQPLYGELSANNVNVGFGVDAIYFHKDKFDIRANFRKTYYRKFYDMAAQLATEIDQKEVNQIREYSQEIAPVPFTYYELSGTYHIKDFEESSKTNMILYKNSYRGNRWASRVPLLAEVPCKVRKIYGARLGAIAWNSATDLSRALQAQGLTNNALLSAEVALPTEMENFTTLQRERVDVFANVSSQSIFLGGSLGWIRNVAVSFESSKYEEGVDDLMLTVFADIFYSPSIRVDDVVFTRRNDAGAIQETRTYAVSPVKTQPLGFRLGIDGRFNRTLSWSYGGEIGYRPGIEGRTFYALFKVSFPVYGTNLDYKVESFGK